MINYNHSWIEVKLKVIFKIIKEEIINLGESSANNQADDEESYELSYQPISNMNNDCIEFLETSRKNSRKSNSIKNISLSFQEKLVNKKIFLGNNEFE